MAGGAVANLPPTRWSVVARAANRERDAGLADLGRIVAAYRPVLVRHLVVRMRLPTDRAEDLVQAFLAEKLVGQNVVRHAVPEKGRFRSFLLKVFSNFVIGRLRSQQALKRLPESESAVTLDDLPELPSGDASLAESFETLWARQVVNRTVERMRDECRSKGRPTLWAVFESRVLAPLLDQGEPLPYEELVARFGLRSPSEASNLLITAKRMFARALHEVVRETVATDRDVEPEIRELKRILAK